MRLIRVVPRVLSAAGALGITAVLVAMGACADSAVPVSRQVAYVSLQGDGRVAVYDVDGNTGEWSLLQTVEAGPGGNRWSGSAPMAVSPDRRRLDVAMRGAASAATFAIAEDGRLTLLDTADIGGSTPFLSRDRTGRWLFAVMGPRVMVHRIDTEGLVAAGSGQEYSTLPGSHAILTDESNRFVFVPQPNSNAISQFRFDAESGNLEPNEHAVLNPPEGRGPRHFRFHPHLDVVYVINDPHPSITAYRLDPENGTLSEFQNVLTLPADYEGVNNPADLHVTPDGRFVYGSNRGHNSIAAFSVDDESGNLTPVDWFETEDTPRSFAIDATGRFLYAAGQGSGNVAAYRIDRDTGRLARFATYEVGPVPTWVEVVTLPE